MAMVQEDTWADFRKGSGKLPNPGKRLFIELVAKSVRNVDSHRDSDGLPFSRKAMIRCGLALNLNGEWEVK